MTWEDAAIATWAAILVTLTTFWVWLEWTNGLWLCDLELHRWSTPQHGGIRYCLRTGCDATK